MKKYKHKWNSKWINFENLKHVCDVIKVNEWIHEWKYMNEDECRIENKWVNEHEYRNRIKGKNVNECRNTNEVLL